MVKKKLVFSFLALCSFLSLSALSGNTKEEVKPRDTKVIVELKESEDESVNDQITETFIQSLPNYIGFNYRIDSTLTELGNYVILSINSDDLDILKDHPLVEVAKEEVYYTTASVEDNETYAGVKEFNPDLDPDVAPDKNYSIDEMKVNTDGNRGKGTLIAVLDNSFQLNHEAFAALDSSLVKYSESEMNDLVSQEGFIAKGDTYYNSKIPFYYDYNDMDNDPLNPTEYHGNHVASIAAANGTYEGIAPNAQLALMKVFGPSGAADSVILKALNDCVKLGVDVINMSLGFANLDEPEERSEEDGKEESLYTSSFRAIQKLHEKGITVSISAGNEGRGNYIKDNEQTNDYGSYYNIAYDNVEPGILGSYANSAYGSIVASGRVTGDSSIKDSASYKQKVSGFSNEGATYDLLLNPDIITPGESIYGAITYDVNDPKAQKYDYLDGTSMAAPNYAGAVASLISDGDYSTEEERVEYMKTLEQRIQSTADPYEQPIVGGYYSPRKQGAGVPNITDALETEVYLEGVREKAKIELKNNDDIKNGHIKFEVTTHNESTSNVTYKATLYVQAPSKASHDDENNKVLSLFDTTIDTYELEDNIVIAPGEGTFEVDYQIDSAAKEYLSDFTSGTYLEGYLVLTPVTSGAVTLSIPYMGYYGDYASASPVEVFNFEKDENTVYSSDLLNSAYKANLSLPYVDFSSSIYGNEDGFSGVINQVVGGRNNLSQYGSEILYDEGKIVVGVDGLSSNIIIQQLVVRSVIDNKVEIIDSTGTVVDDFKLASYSEEETYNMNNGRLFKSMIQTLTGSGLESPKAYLTIKFRDANNTLVYPAGEYTLRFTYDLAAGSTVTKDYKLEVRDASATSPFIEEKTLDADTIENASTLRIDLEDNVTSVKANNNELEILSDDKGLYVSLDLNEYKSRKKVYLEVLNEFNLTTKQLFNLSDITKGLAVEHNELKNTYTPTIEETLLESGSGDINYRYKYDVVDARGNSAKLSNLTLVAKVPEGYSLLKEEITVKDGVSGKDLEFEVNENGYLRVSSTSQTVDISYLKAKADVNVPLIVGISVAAIVVIGAVVVVVIVVNKKKNKGSSNE